MEQLQNFLLILQVIIALVLIIIVLMQKTDEDSLSGIGGNSNPTNSAFSSKSSVNIVTKITFFLVIAFMLNCLFLASISKLINKSISDKITSKASKDSTNSKDLKNSTEGESKENSNTKQVNDKEIPSL
jgi:preprotein translocase subunit SecG